MKIVVCDITGRTINYDAALCEALHRTSENDSVELWIPQSTKVFDVKTRYFYKIIPPKYQTSANTFVRVLKAFNTLISYIQLLWWVHVYNPDVFHLQWFPFLSLGVKGAWIDLTFLKLLRIIGNKSSFVFTIHNLCPHSMKEVEREMYNPFFIKALGFFDYYIVHTQKTKEEACRVFNIPDDKVAVVYHGIFSPKEYTFKRNIIESNKIKLIMYGSQDRYKGTDVFIEALSLLPEKVKSKIKVTICGSMEKSFLDENIKKQTGVEINWMPYYIEDNLLYKMIDESNIIVLPYRRISQSGVLLLALDTNKFIITSNLPTFVETLEGIPEELFFQKEDPSDFARVIAAYCNYEVDYKKMQDILGNLKEKYTWENSAIKTKNIYHTIC